jgi:hypothetical protein
VIFTREPIIETIITPREGYKLSVRNSKKEEQEEYQIDALEVVSFGSSLFFRSQERPKCFLVPVSDYEVIETRDTRIVLKSASHDKTIKIGGGRETKTREQPQEKRLEQTEEERSEQPLTDASQESRNDRKRDNNRRRHRSRRRPGEERQEWQQKKPDSQEEKEEGELNDVSLSQEGTDIGEETQIAPPIFPSLIPPPTVLISETLSRYKDASFFEEKKKETEEERKKKKKPAKEESEEELAANTKIPDPDSSGAEIELHEETIFFTPDSLDGPYLG